MSIDSKIVELFGVVNQRKQKVEEFEASIKKSWLTNCSFKSPNQTVPPINIQTASEETIVDIVSRLIVLEQAYSKLQRSPIVSGFPISDWMEDCKKRLDVISIRQHKVELAELEKRLDAIVSPEQRREMELAELTKLLA